MRIPGLLLFVTAVLSAPVLADDTGQTARRLDVTIRVEMGYLLYLPQEYATKESWPLVLFLHGSGERGDDLELVKKHGPPKLIGDGKAFPFIVVSPQCPNDQSWEPIQLTALLDEVTKTQKVDQDRIYVTGLSMGGFATWEWQHSRHIGLLRSPRSAAAVSHTGLVASSICRRGPSTGQRTWECR